MLAKPRPNCKLRPAELRSHIPHRTAAHPDYPTTTDQGLKSPADRLPVDTGLPLTGREAIEAMGIVCIAFISVCLILKFLSN